MSDPRIKELTLWHPNQTQNDKVLAYLRDGNTITSMEAYTKLGITQLARCLSDLGKRGYVFNRPRVKLTSGKIVCVYSLKE